MIPLRFMLGFLTMWVLINVGCNFAQGLSMTDNIPEGLSPATGIGGITTTYSVDASGAPAQYQNLSPTGLETFQQWAFFDYPAIFNDPDTGEPDELRSFIRYGMLVIVGIGFLIALAFTLKQIFGL